MPLSFHYFSTLDQVCSKIYNGLFCEAQSGQQSKTKLNPTQQENRLVEFNIQRKYSTLVTITRTFEVHYLFIRIN